MKIEFLFYVSCTTVGLRYFIDISQDRKMKFQYFIYFQFFVNVAQINEVNNVLIYNKMCLLQSFTKRRHLYDKIPDSIKLQIFEKTVLKNELFLKVRAIVYHIEVISKQIFSFQKRKYCLPELISKIYDIHIENKFEICFC